VRTKAAHVSLNFGQYTLYSRIVYLFRKQISDYVTRSRSCGSDLGIMIMSLNTFGVAITLLTSGVCVPLV
jgi:hypothetical protein